MKLKAFAGKKGDSGTSELIPGYRIPKSHKVFKVAAHMDMLHQEISVVRHCLNTLPIKYNIFINSKLSKSPKIKLVKRSDADFFDVLDRIGEILQKTVRELQMLANMDCYNMMLSIKVATKPAPDWFNFCTDQSQKALQDMEDMFEWIVDGVGDLEIPSGWFGYGAQKLPAQHVIEHAMVYSRVVEQTVYEFIDYLQTQDLDSGKLLTTVVAPYLNRLSKVLLILNYLLSLK